MIGRTILGYQVDEEIGSGGFGTVYKVSKTNPAGTYIRALKHITLPTKKQYASVLNSMGGDYTKADGYFANILNDIVSEINILSTLSESGIQNIVRYYENDIIETESPKSYDIYILMEFLTPFTDYIEEKTFTVSDVIGLGKDILKALAVCHEKNIIHRDIKDDNIFVSSEGVYKLGDFGVSKVLKDKSRAESVKGTPNFIAPEVYFGKEKYDNTVDLYSLGIVLYKLLNMARNPFLPKYPEAYNSLDEDNAFEARMTGQVPPLPCCAENALGEAILKAIMPRRDRYNSAAEFLQALEEAQRTLSEEELSAKLGIGASQKLRSASSDIGAVAPKAINNDTIGIVAPSRKVNETVALNHNKRMSETIGSAIEEKPKSYEPEKESDKNISYRDDIKEEPHSNPTDSGKASADSYTPIDYFPSDKWNNYTEPTSAYTPVPTKTAPKSNLKWLLYLSPVIILVIGIVLNLVLIPIIYGSGVSFIEWLLGDPNNIAETLKNASNVLIPIYIIILIKILNVILAAAFAISLFFIGRSLHNKKPLQNDSAKLHGKEPYLTTISMLEEIKLIGSKKTEPARRAVQLLNERLKNESAFGEGSDAVVNCENEMASYLQAIAEQIPDLNDDVMADKATKNIEMLCQRCMTKLKLRIELKKK